MEAIPSNLTENCKIISKTTRQQALIKQFQKPTFDCSAPDWGSKKQYLTIFQNAAKKVVLRNRINKYLSILRSLKSCSSSKTCINYYVEKTADVKEELKFGRSCKFPILNSDWKEKCLESFVSTDREELNSNDLPNHLHPRLPFVYKRMEYYPSNLMDISSCHDNYLRINKYNKSDEELCSPNEPRNEFYGSLKSNCGVERMGSPNISNESLLKSESFSQVTASLRPLEDMTNSFKQWRHLPHVFNRNHCSKNLSFPRRMNYADLFLSGLPLPTDKFNVRHCV